MIDKAKVRLKKYFRRSKKVFKAYSLLSLFIVAGIVVFSVFFYSHSRITFFVSAAEQNIKDKMRAASTILSKMATAEEISAHYKAMDIKSSDYQELRQKIIDFASDVNVKYAYFLYVEDDKDDKVHYVIHSSDEAAVSRVGAPPETFYEHKGMLPAYQRGEVSVSALGDYSRGREGLISAYAPVRDANGKVAALCGVDIEDSQILRMYKTGHWLFVIELASVALVIICGVFGFFRYHREASAVKSANIIKSRFLSRVSHSIRTPMNAIMGMSELAEMNYGKPQGLEYISHIKHAGSNLLAIINEILDFSAIESGKPRISSAKYSLSAVLSDVYSTAIKLKDKQEVKLVVDVDPSIPDTLIGDEDRVREILVNLLSNAIKYTKIGFIKLAVRFLGDGTESIRLIFEVSDSGSGIRPKELNGLMAVFTRGNDKYTSSVDGLGLGLSLTNLLCRAMGGFVKVDSKYGHGSKFTAEIMQMCEADATLIGVFEIKATEVEEAVHVNFVAPDFRVLIVDDVEMNIKVVEGLLEPYRMKVDSCLDGRDAVEMVQDRDYDLVLMDHMMPGMDGFEAVAAIRGLGGRFIKLPIAVQTANVVLGMKEIFLKNGFDDYLPKPIDRRSLNELIERWAPDNKRVYTDKSPSPVSRRITAKGGLSESPIARLASIDGLNIAMGIAATGGVEAAYREVLKLYRRDVDARISFLNPQSAESNIKNFITNAHALKSASATIGALALSVDAKALEEAGNRGDLAFIRSKVDNFRLSLINMVERITEALAAGETAPATENRETGKKTVFPVPLPTLQKLKEALEKEDVGASDACLTELLALPLDSEARKAISAASDLVLTSDFIEAEEIIAKLISTGKGNS